MATPFFILSSGRSGSTLLASMLNMHPNLFIPVELLGLYSYVPGHLRHYGDLNRPFNLGLLCQDLARTGQLHEFGVEIDRGALYRRIETSNRDLRAIISALYDTLLDGSGKIRLGDKTPNNSPFAQVIKGVFPEAQVIHLIRDGRDCALSSRRGRSGINQRNVYELGILWARNNRRIAEIWGSSPGQYLRVRYEDLVAEPAAELDRVCRFLGESYTPSLLDYSTGAFAKANADLLGHHQNLTNVVMHENVRKWVTGLSVDEVHIYQSLAAGGLTEFGYELSERPPSRLWKMRRLLACAVTQYRRLRRALSEARVTGRGVVAVHLKRRIRRARAENERNLPT